MAYGVSGKLGLDNLRYMIDTAYRASQASPDGTLGHDVLGLRGTADIMVPHGSRAVYRFRLGNEDRIVRLDKPNTLAGARELDSTSYLGLVVLGKRVRFPDVDLSRQDWLNSHMLLEALPDMPVNGHKPPTFAVAIGHVAFDKLEVGFVTPNEDALGAMALSLLPELQLEPELVRAT